VDLFNPVELLIRVPVVLLALTVHEFCHGYFAYRMGDPTAHRMGRLTLNPIAHLDPLGTICLMFAPIGWAKPVPINPLNFHDHRKGILVSTAAGPASNLAQAILFALLLRALMRFGGSIMPGLGTQAVNAIQAVGMLCFFGVLINVGLAVFNCLPLYPLDGFHITLQLIRPESQEQFAETRPYGPFVILALVLLGNLGDFDILRYLIAPPANLIFRYVAGVGPQL
jgi:Zn-dependent protease